MRRPILGLLVSAAVLLGVPVLAGAPSGTGANRPAATDLPPAGSALPSPAPQSPEPQPSETESPATESLATEPPAGPTSAPPSSGSLVPIGIAVPRLGIEAPVLATGVAEDGQAEVPEDIRRVGWYRFGPAAGAAQGSTVIVGHVDSFEQGRGALYPLRKAVAGDEIRVDTPTGPVAYQVVEVTRYDKQGLPTAELFRRSGEPVLTVITCGGPYNRSLGGYQQNLVVTAVPVGGAA